MKSTNNQRPSDQWDKFVIRFTDSNMRQELKQRAALNRRSMNAEILCLIEVGMKAGNERQQ